MLFFHSRLANILYAAVGAIVFMGYIVFDTQMVIKTYGLDEFIWATVALYLDVINLFLRYVISLLFVMILSNKG